MASYTEDMEENLTENAEGNLTENAEGNLAGTITGGQTTEIPEEAGTKKWELSFVTHWRFCRVRRNR